jgi:hypothetical protein
MFTEIKLDNARSVPATIMTRLSQMLKRHLTPLQCRQVSVSFYLLPEQRDYRFRSENQYAALYRGETGVASNSTESAL